VRAVHEMDEGVAEPVARVVRRQLQHRLDAFGVARERFLALGAGDDRSLELRRRPDPSDGNGGDSGCCPKKPATRELRALHLPLPAFSCVWNESAAIRPPPAAGKRW